MLYSFSLSLPLLLAAANGLLPALYYAPSILARLGASFAALALAIVLAHLEQRLRVSRAQRVASKAGAQSPPWPRGYLPLDFDVRAISLHHLISSLMSVHCHAYVSLSLSRRFSGTLPRATSSSHPRRTRISSSTRRALRSFRSRSFVRLVATRHMSLR